MSIAQLNLQKYFSKKSILIVGVGKTGISVFSNLKDICAKTICFDDNQESLRLFASNYGSCYIDDNLHKNYQDYHFDYILISPGISETHFLYAYAVQQGILISDLNIFFIKYPGAKCIAITGTNGKSTAVSLLHHVLCNIGAKCALGGNIGTCVLSLEESDIFALEISSFQLCLLYNSTIKNVMFEGVIMLNIALDHLDRYDDSVEKYALSKMKIFSLLKQNKIGILGLYNIEQDVKSAYLRAINSVFSKITCNNIYLMKEKGIAIDQYTTNIMSAKSIEITNDGNITDGDTKISIDGMNFIGDATTFLVASCYKIISFIYKVGVQEVLRVMQTFDGIEHRLERIEQTISNSSASRKITFINDSKATNVISTANALKSFNNIYWIAGGKDTYQDLSSLLQYQSKILKCYFFGETAFKLYDLFKNNIHSKSFISLGAAFSDAIEDASNNNNDIIIVFSPACKSFDQFKNFEERGKYFKQLVQNIK